MCQPICKCIKKAFGRRVKKKIVRINSREMGVNENSMIKTEKEGKSLRISEMPSTPSKLKTETLTEIYRLPSREFTTVEEIVASQGFEMNNELGKGAYATVFKARRLRDNLLLACKVMDIGKASQSIAGKNEIFTMEHINHPHIIRLYKHFIVEYDHNQKEKRSRSMYIFMQLAEGQSLSDHMKSKPTGLPEDVCRRMFAQTTSALKHMHDRRIAHRDLKAGNILLDKNNNCLVSDFGLSKIARRKDNSVIKSTKYCGTMLYMAPEIFMIKEYGMDYDPFPTDVWALGVLLFFLINHEYPYTNPILEQALAHNFKFSYKKQFDPSNELFDLLYRMLHPYADSRLTMPEIYKHPWCAKELSAVEEAIIAKDKCQKVTGLADAKFEADLGVNTSKPKDIETSDSSSKSVTPVKSKISKKNFSKVKLHNAPKVFSQNRLSPNSTPVSTKVSQSRKVTTTKSPHSSPPQTTVGLATETSSPNTNEKSDSTSTSLGKN
ncbi:hypothetical protein BLOT_008500 [Blomia tropicalis]|nr:hypothetical protein BLOT_008500 [Blomia tropicalis]